MKKLQSWRRMPQEQADIREEEPAEKVTRVDTHQKRSQNVLAMRKMNHQKMKKCATMNPSPLKNAPIAPERNQDTRKGLHTMSQSHQKTTNQKTTATTLQKSASTKTLAAPKTKTASIALQQPWTTLIEQPHRQWSLLTIPVAATSFPASRETSRASVHLAKIAHASESPSATISLSGWLIMIMPWELWLQDSGSGNTSKSNLPMILRWAMSNFNFSLHLRMMVYLIHLDKRGVALKFRPGKI